MFTIIGKEAALVINIIICDIFCWPDNNKGVIRKNLSFYIRSISIKIKIILTKYQKLMKLNFHLFENLHKLLLIRNQLFLP